MLLHQQSFPCNLATSGELFVDIWHGNFSLESQMTRGESSMGLFYYFNTLWIEHTRECTFLKDQETKVKASLQKKGCTFIN
jgi:hypothetical protein